MATATLRGELKAAWGWLDCPEDDFKENTRTGSEEDKNSEITLKAIAQDDKQEDSNTEDLRSPLVAG